MKTQETDTSTDDETDELTLKHLNEELVSTGALLLAVSFAILAVVLLDVFLILAACSAVMGLGCLLGSIAACGNPYARAFFDGTSSEEIDWEMRFPEGDD